MIRLLLQQHKAKVFALKKTEVRSMGRQAAGVIGIRLT